MANSDNIPSNILAFTLDANHASGPKLKALAVAEDLPQVNGEIQLPTESMFRIPVLPQQPAQSTLEEAEVLTRQRSYVMPEEFLLPTESVFQLRTVPDILDAQGTLPSKEEMFRAIERVRMGEVSAFESSQQSPERLQQLLEFNQRNQERAERPYKTNQPTQPAAPLPEPKAMKRPAIATCKRKEKEPHEEHFDLERELRELSKLSAPQCQEELPSISHLRARLEAQKSKRKPGVQNYQHIKNSGRASSRPSNFIHASSPQQLQPASRQSPHTSTKNPWLLPAIITGTSLVGTLGFLLGMLL